MTNKKDKIYRKQHKKISPFAFNEDVIRVFPDMINRSVPGYKQIIESLELIAANYCKNDTFIYDLGCSLGASLLSLRKGVKDKKCTVVGIDNSESMLKLCKKNIIKEHNITPTELIHADICDHHLLKSSIVSLNFTLQFVDVKKRYALLQKIFNSLCDGGVLILSEKIANNDSNNILEKLHLDFKKAQGYTNLEISQKRIALENTLIPETLHNHQLRLKEIGFKKVIVWMQYFNFISLLAIK